jgi:hypothetical protein
LQRLPATASTASHSHCAGVKCVCAAFARSVAYSLADAHTPIVVLRTAAGSPLGRPPADLRVVTSGCMVWTWQPVQLLRAKLRAPEEASYLPNSEGGIGLAHSNSKNPNSAVFRS